ncbi:hypothetical protein ACFE04_006164 [Oxalis oulophora]
MFFSGDPSTRKRVDLGGRSSKERDRKKLLEQTRLERNRRLWMRQQTSAAIKIQKCFRARLAVKAEQARVRESFFATYGPHCQHVDRGCFGPDSNFLQQFLFFFDTQNADDFSALLEICRLLQCLLQETEGDIVSIFAGVDYSIKHALVDYRVKKIAFICLQADELLMSPDEYCSSTTLLLPVIGLLIDPKLPWACKVVGYLSERNAFGLFREIILKRKLLGYFWYAWCKYLLGHSLYADFCCNDVEQETTRTCNPSSGKVSSLEHVLSLMVSHIADDICSCPTLDLRFSFSSQILSIPFLWQPFPFLKEVFARHSQYYIHQMAMCVKNHVNLPPNDFSIEYPGFTCLLGNILETAGVALSRGNRSFEMAMDLAAVMTCLLEAVPPLKSLSGSIVGEDDSSEGDEAMDVGLNRDLEQQISNGIDQDFIRHLTNAILGGILDAPERHDTMPDDQKVAAVGAVCALLLTMFNTIPLERIMSVVAYRTKLVSVLWDFIQHCDKRNNWPSFTGLLTYLPGDAPGWLLPLAVFCPLYNHMLMTIDSKEFYEEEKPLSLKDIKCLVVILRDALWKLLWVFPLAHSKPVEFIQQRVSSGASEVLSQLQDWNNRKQFTKPSDFHVDVKENFISQAGTEGTRAHDILKQAPFLVPFTSRVKIFTQQLTAVKQRHGSHGVFTRNRFSIRRDHILEDAYNQMSALSEEDLRGVIRVTFVNELGVEEAGIDGGGIFKDFMENITRTAFDVQYGLFKETPDHLLYPNPGSGLSHEQHLQFFHFLGTLLGKAMFEGILVDIPFATFFLSKLKQKYNFLNDLPSLDPELYRHLIFLKAIYVDKMDMLKNGKEQHYEGDVSELELYFVIVNNEYGEQTEEELQPGGSNIRVTNKDRNYFIHLVAKHRLNYQIRHQSSHFLRGFQQLMQKDWIDMFNEKELQLLISGSLDCLDVDDLRSNTNYVGGYSSEHYVIEMFWEVLKSFSLENQKKFLKFVTGCSRGPLLGFKYLEPLFCIQRAGGAASEEALDRLPTAATCMNLLKLPPYASKEQMETKLLYAINADAVDAQRLGRLSRVEVAELDPPLVDVMQIHVANCPIEVVLVVM